MNNPWKLATLGLVLTMVTALSTGLTTAYVMRPTPVQPTVEARPAARAQITYATAPVPYATAPMPAHAVVQPAAVVTPAVATAPAVVTPAVVTRPAVVRQVAMANDCATGGQRAMKIAKPGLIGALGGAGLGAIGGAIAGGGSGAGKGALIGGLAGTALGAGYGAYKTKQECGTIFGGSSGFASAPATAAGPVIAPQSAWSAAGAGADAIRVFNAR